MAAKAEKVVSEVIQEKEILFKCKFCGEQKPLSELVVMRQYYPQLAACKQCARGSRQAEADAAAENTGTETAQES